MPEDSRWNCGTICRIHVQRRFDGEDSSPVWAFVLPESQERIGNTSMVAIDRYRSQAICLGMSKLSDSSTTTKVTRKGGSPNCDGSLHSTIPALGNRPHRSSPYFTIRQQVDYHGGRLCYRMANCKGNF